MTNIVENIKTSSGEYAIGGDAFDGPFVESYKTVASDVTFSVGEKKQFDLSSYLPDDDYDYLVKFDCYVKSKNSSGSYFQIRMFTGPYYCQGPYVLCAMSRSSYAQLRARTFSFPIPAGERVLGFYNANGANQSTNFNVRLKGYQRIGKNKRTLNSKKLKEVNTVNGWASNFNSANGTVLQIPYKYNNNAEYVVKFTTPSVYGGTVQAIVHSESFFAIELRDNFSIEGYNWGSSSRVPIFTAAPNTTCWVKIVINGTNLSYYYSMDGVNYTLGASVTDSSSSISSNYPIWFGANSASEGNVFYGSIDLKETYINVNGERVYNAYEEIPERIINVAPVGNVWERSLGALDNFVDRANYAVMPKKFNPGSSTWCMQFKVWTPETIDSSADYPITGNGGNTYQNAPEIGVSGGKWRFVISYNGGSSGNLNPSGSYTPQSNTAYWLRFYYTGTAYKLDYSLDGKTFINDITENSTTPIYQSTFPFLIGSNWYSSSSTQVWGGKIDLNESWITVNNEVWWTGVKGTATIDGSEVNSGVTIIPENSNSNIERFTTPSTSSEINGFVIGSPTISNGVVSNFSNKDYVDIYYGSNYDYEYYIKFTTPSAVDPDYKQCIFDLEYICNLEIAANGWDIVSYNYQAKDNNIIFTAQASTTYWMKIRLFENEKTFSYSTDGVTYSTPVTFKDSMNISGEYLKMRFGSHYYYVNGEGEVFHGSIDFNETYIKHNGEVIWNGIGNSKNTSIGGDIIPGRMYFPGAAVFSSITLTANTPVSYSISSLLPDDDYDYECYFKISGNSVATANKKLSLKMWSGNDIITTPNSACEILGYTTDTAANIFGEGAASFIISANSRNIVVNSLENNATSCWLRLCDYRRLPKSYPQALVTGVNNGQFQGEFADGAFVYAYREVVTGTTFAANSSQNFSVKDYLPPVPGAYEIWYDGFSTTGSSSGNAVRVQISSGWDASKDLPIAMVRTRTNSTKSDGQCGRFISFKALNSNSTTITIRNTGDASGTSGGVYVRFYGYRYLGTNI